MTKQQAAIATEIYRTTWRALIKGLRGEDLWTYVVTKLKNVDRHTLSEDVRDVWIHMAMANFYRDRYEFGQSLEVLSKAKLTIPPAEPEGKETRGTKLKRKRQT